MAGEKEPKKSPLDDLRIGLTDAAKLIGKSIQHVRNLVREGFIPEPVDGKYSAVAVASGALKARDAEDRRAAKSAATSRVQDARAAEIELRLREKRGAHQAQGQAEAVFVIDEFFGGLKSDLLAIPARVTSDMVTRRKIEDGIEFAFAAAGKRAGDAAGRVETAGKDWRAAGKADARRVGKKQPRLPVKRRRPRSA